MREPLTVPVRLFIVGAVVVVLSGLAEPVSSRVTLGSDPPSSGVADLPNAGLHARAGSDEGSDDALPPDADAVLTTVAVGEKPRAVVFSPDSSRAYVSHHGEPTIYVIQTSDHTVIDTVSMGTPSGSHELMGVDITPDGALLFVAWRGKDVIVPVKTSDLSLLAEIPVGDQPIGVSITPDGASAYVAGPDGVDVIDTAAYTVVAHIDFPGDDYPYAVEVSPDGKYAYVNENRHNKVYIIDTSLNVIADSVDVGDGPHHDVAVSPDGTVVYTTGSEDGTVAAIRLSDGHVDHVSIGGGPSGVAVTPDSRFLYVSAYSTNRVSLIRTFDFSVSDHIGVGSKPDGIIDCSTDGRYIYVPNQLGNSVSVIAARRDTSSLSYDGPLYLPHSSFMLDEADDSKITMGDHVHLQLPFRNGGSQSVSNSAVVVEGNAGDEDAPGVSVYNGSTYVRQATISLEPGTVGPGETGVADFWIYVGSSASRASLRGDTWLQVTTGAGAWKIPIAVDTVDFGVAAPDLPELTDRSCLHSPDMFEIQRYAQYAAGDTTEMPSDNTEDPDDPERAVTNVVMRVNSEFDFADVWDRRVPDVTLLQYRGDDMGVCAHYADLTTGLVRSLGLPARIINSFWRDKYLVPVGHLWLEVYLGSEAGWNHADSTWGIVSSPLAYEGAGYTVRTAWADLQPLSSASMHITDDWRCINSCYEEPVGCSDCFRDSRERELPPQPVLDLSCVDDVTKDYQEPDDVTEDFRGPFDVTRKGADEQLAMQLEAPILVTRTVPFTLAVGLMNDTSIAQGAITATLAISEFVDSPAPLFQVASTYQMGYGVSPGETVTVTWVVTPLIAGSGLPLMVTAESGELFEVAMQPLVVKEPDAQPPLTLAGLCGYEPAKAGQLLTLTAYALGEVLQPLTDTLTTVTATVYASPTVGYSTTSPLHLDADGFFRGAVTLPVTAPIGTYWVGFAATRPGYQDASGRSTFFVSPSLSMTLEISPTEVAVTDSVTLAALVSDREAVVTDASVWAAVATPLGVITVPMMYGGAVYSATFRPVGLRQNLGGNPHGGEWQIIATSDYYGSATEAIKTITVFWPAYLPLTFRDG